MLVWDVCTVFVILCRDCTWFGYLVERCRPTEVIMSTVVGIPYTLLLWSVQKADGPLIVTIGTDGFATALCCMEASDEKSYRAWLIGDRRVIRCCKSETLRLDPSPGPVVCRKGSYAQHLPQWRYRPIQSSRNRDGRPTLRFLYMCYLLYSGEEGSHLSMFYSLSSLRRACRGRPWWGCLYMS